MSTCTWGSKGGTMVRALASHQCGLGSNPDVEAICGLSLLLVLSLAPRGFSLGTLVFPSPQKPTLSNSNLIWNARTRLNKFIWTLSASWVKKQFTIYNFLHCTFQVTSQIIYCYCTLLSYWDNGKRRSRGPSCHRKGTLGRWPYLEKMLLFDCYLLCPSTVSLNLWRQTLWHTSGLRQLVNERLYPPLWMKDYFIWRLTTLIHTLGLILD